MLVQVMFASLAIAGRYVLPHVPAGVLVCLRVFGAAAVLGLANAAVGRWVRDRADLLRIAALGWLGISANQTLFLFGLGRTTAINATILVTTVPVFTVLGSVLVRREPPSARKFAGIAIAGLGVVYLIGPDRISLAPEAALGDALIVLGMVCYAAYFIGSKPILRRYGSLTVSFYAMLFAAIGVLPFGLAGAVRTDWGAVPAPVWGWVVYIVVFPTIVTYLLNLWALRRASSNLVAVYIYLQPLFAAAVAPLVLPGERLTTRAAAAALAIFAGLALVIHAERRQDQDLALAPLGE